MLVEIFGEREEVLVLQVARGHHVVLDQVNELASLVLDVLVTVGQEVLLGVHRDIQSKQLVLEGVVGHDVPLYLAGQ